MGIRIGRPKKSNSKNERITVRMTSGERKRLNYICNETGKSASEIFREMFDLKFDEMLKTGYSDK